jgi:hypothetical protein
MYIVKLTDKNYKHWLEYAKGKCEWLTDDMVDNPEHYTDKEQLDWAEGFFGILIALREAEKA